MLRTWDGTPIDSFGSFGGVNTTAPGAPDSHYSGSCLPNQPIVQDPRMPLMDNPNTATQLEEAKRRLEDVTSSVTKMRQSR